MSDNHLSSPAGHRNSKILRWILAAFLALWAVISMFQMVSNMRAPLGEHDFWIYWYTGLFVRQGQDPYQAFLDGERPAVPMSFTDGTATDLDDILLPGMVPAPANTFPLVFILSGFSFLTWETAKIVWFWVTLVLIAIIPWMTFGLLPRPERPDRHTLWLIALAFIGFSSTRFAATIGQLTFLVFALMLASVLTSRKHPVLAGLLLGLALSKYSLSLGFLFYFMFFERNPRLVLSALGVQLTGILALAVISGSSLWTILDGYLSMLSLHADMEGVHLASLLPTGMDIPVAIILTLCAGIPLWIMNRKSPGVLSERSRFHFLVIILLWNLLVAYHRAYDASTYVLFLTYLATLINQPVQGTFSSRGRTILGWFALGTVLVWILPAGSLTRSLLPQQIGPVVVRLTGYATTIILLASMAISIVVLSRDADKMPPRHPSDEKFKGR